MMTDDTTRADETPQDEHLRCVVDALQVGTRVCPREPLPEPSPLHLALLDALANATTWRRY